MSYKAGKGPPCLILSMIRPMVSETGQTASSEENEGAIIYCPGEPAHLEICDGDHADTEDFYFFANILTLCQNEVIINIMTLCQNIKRIKERMKMKKNIGLQLALYPMPVTVVGAMNGDKPTSDGKVDYHTLKPVLFEFPTYEYLKTGEVLGKCLSFKENTGK